MVNPWWIVAALYVLGAVNLALLAQSGIYRPSVWAILVFWPVITVACVVEVSWEAIRGKS